ncbi:Stabilin-2 [Bulinus truncatus]|nr:Stabilin-2 [Bulinus truncatus]
MSVAMCDSISNQTISGSDTTLTGMDSYSTTNSAGTTREIISTAIINSSINTEREISVIDTTTAVTIDDLSSSTSSLLTSGVYTNVSITSSGSFLFSSSKEESNMSFSSSTPKATSLIVDDDTTGVGSTQNKSFMKTSPLVQRYTSSQPNDFQKTTPQGTDVTSDPYDILGTFSDLPDETGQQKTTTDAAIVSYPYVPITKFPKILPAGFCVKNVSRVYKTGCVECSKATCKTGFIASIEKCEDFSECNFECVIKEGAVQCCDGYRGVSCEECPGGYLNPCSGHGLCQDEYPFCSCDPGFSGIACEKCEESRYGENCDLVCSCMNGQCNSGRLGDGSCTCYSGYRGARCDEKLNKCEDLECFKNTSRHSRCIEVNGSATCICDIGYRYDPKITDCVAVNPCESPISPCGNNSICAMVSPGRHNCTCEEDYIGDGMVCLPINPCDSDVRLCGENTFCSMTGPNKYQCSCIGGYENYKPGIGCSLINVCRSNSCPKNAVCETYEPFIFQCTCKTGFINRDNKCVGNIYQMLSELNNAGQYYRDFDLALQMMQHYYYIPLQNHGPFTIFIPTDKAFREAFGGMRGFLQDEDRARQILRLHIILGKHRVESLRTLDKIFTLQGTEADITRQRSGLRYKLEGFIQNAKIIANNIEASNGMIHLVNKILTPPPKILGDRKKSAMEIIRQEPEYDKFEKLINALNMSEEFNKENITIFAPSNAAWNRLPNGALQFFMEDEAQGQQKLRAILRNHIYAGYVDVTDLIQKPNLLSLQGVTLAVNITRQGQILLNQNVTITQVDIPCKGNVYYYHIDGILTPSYLGDIIQSSCPEETQLRVKGPCQVNCKGVCPQENDIPSLTDEREKCRFNSFMPLIAVEMCHQICYRKIQVPRCCKGFYGQSCLPCPGGFYNPCNGNGQCLDTTSGTGECLCRPGFVGTACQMCKMPKVFGPNCNQTCTCLRGACDDGPSGSGKCKRGSCQDGFVGDDCENKLVPCGQGLKLCHAHSQCYLDDDNNYRCRCSLGFTGDGRKCTEINPCLNDNGGCHAQATCTKLGPGTSRCDCNPGWTGDGFYCAPKVACSSHSDCHVNATCRDLELDKHHCICNVGYRGNGTHCELVNLCVVNNGGCHPKALCTPLMFGVRNCSCPEPLAGDGSTCFGTIADQVVGHPNLTALAKYLEMNNLLSLHKDPYEKLTFFAPSDAALNTYLSKLGTNDKSYLENPLKSLDFFRFHTLTDIYNVERLKSMAGIFRTYETLYDGFSLRIINDNQSLHILANHSSFAVILEGDIPAVNGYVHIIDKVLEPFIPDTNPLTLEEFLRSQPELELFYKALKALNMSEEFNKENITIFAPSNAAWNRLPNGALQFLMEDEASAIDLNLTLFAQGQQKLRAILRNHIYAGYVDVTDLIQKPNLLSLQGVTLVVNITRQGQILLNQNVTITQVDIPCKGNVYYYHIDGILTPSYLGDIIQSSCPEETQLRVKGPCQVNCKGVCPQENDIPSLTDEREKCRFNSFMPLIAVEMCHQICYRKIQVPRCCKGFYGQSCLPCPGGFYNPCNGNGQCLDTTSGTGECLCRPGFVGTACQMCKMPKVFGPNCNQTCTCLRGACDDGPSGSGKCKRGSCQDGFVGDDCENKLVPCGQGLKLCHAHSQCYLDDDNNYRCRCSLGFTGDGRKCTEINPCLNDNGGCHAQATCTKLGPGTSRCDCNPGWTGDGFYCAPKVACSSHSDCHVNATCRDLELDKHHCICNVGYRGNGTHCELVNLCVVNNGGCHPKALCTPLMFGVRNCSCPEPLAGDGSTCFGTIADQVVGHPNLTALAKYLEMNNLLSLHKDPYEKLTFFAPSDAALNTYLSKLGTNDKSYLENPLKSLDFFRFHTLTDIYNVERLKSMAGIIRTYETLYDGFSLRIINDNNQSLHIVANHSSFAMILEGDIPAVNGYVHIIDKVLEPFIPDTNPLTLEEFLQSQPELELFYQALKETGVLDEIRDLDQFTVFAPVNSAMQLMNRSQMSEHLKYYIVKKYVFTPTLETGDTVYSLLGFKHQMEFSVDQDKVLVNAVRLIKSDLLVQGGVLHIIEGLLHPVLHFCNNVSILISYSSCETCDKVGACPAGFVPVVPIIKQRCAFNMSDSLGCQIACEKNETVLQCCDGFYGETCEECPGGSETPCNGHGLCSHGMTGDGRCSCDIGYVGQDCGSCLQANKTPPFCTDATADCSYMNGNCSMNAVCTATKSGPSCRCKQGFIGDGYKCSSPCETPLAGGCHQHAQCLFNETSHVVQCLCNQGYIGNGTWCTRSENPCSVSNGGCDTDRAYCTFIKDTDTLSCSCLVGYVGNGTLCNKDLTDAVSRMPALRYFNTWLTTELMANKTKKSTFDLQQLTLFAPINQNWGTVDLLDLVISDQYVRLSGDKVSDNDISTVSKNTSFISAAGKLINITVNDQGEFFVNGIPVVEKNIEASNGIIHLTAQPITELVDVRVAASKLKDKSKSVIIIVTIAAVVIVALLVVAALVIYKKKYEGILKIFKKTEVGSESNLSFARLSAQEEDSDSFRDAEASKYENPIFNDTDVIMTGCCLPSTILPDWPHIMGVPTTPRFPGQHRVMQLAIYDINYPDMVM